MRLWLRPPFLFSRNWCRDLNSMSRLDSLFLYYISMSRPRIDAAASFLLSASLFLGRSFSFRLRHHSVVLSLQADCNSKLLLCSFSCRDVDIRSRPSNFFNHCNSCHDLKCMSRPFFFFPSSHNLISQSQQFPFNFLFLVTT